MSCKTLLTLTLGSAAALLALPAHAIDEERVILRIGAMSADAESQLRGDGEFEGEPISFREDFDFGGDEVVPRIGGQFRLGDRHRLVFDYFNYDKDRRWTLGEDISYGGETIPAGSSIGGDVEFEVASFAYDFAVVESDTVSWGLQLGVAYAGAKARASAEIDGERWDARDTADGFAPVVGTRLTFAPVDRWRFILQGQYLDADWGDFGDYDGDLSRAKALAEYRFTDRFGVHLGYDWFRLDVDRYGSDGMFGLRQEFKGPVAGLTVSF